MKLGGEIAGFVLSQVMREIVPGKTTLELNKKADLLMREKGVTPSFLTVDDYKYAICATVNDEVVHGLPSTTKLKSGDIVGIDLGVLFQGLHTDTAVTVGVGETDPETKKLLDVGEKALNAGIHEARAGKRVGYISSAIQKVVERHGYSVVRALVGHGVGKALHEDPQVPGFLSIDREETPLLVDGMTLAIEVIYNKGDYDVMYKRGDGWTISTADGSLSGLFEHTVLITGGEPAVLTRRA